MLAFFLVGLAAATLVGFARVVARRRRAPQPVDDLTGLPSRLRDPETGEYL